MNLATHYNPKQRRLVTRHQSMTQPSIVLCVEACLAVSKVAHCIKKFCKGGGMDIQFVHKNI